MVKILNWKDTYLGYNINKNINPKDVVKQLLKNNLCGVAHGKAEFGSTVIRE